MVDYKKSFLALFMVLTLFSFQLSAEEPTWLMRPVEKLGRGIANVAFSPLEMPMRWAEVKNDQGGIAGLTYGTLRGVCFVVARIGVGIADIITFPFPLPNCPDFPNDAGWGYGPIMTPSWVVPVSSDWQNFVYDNTAVVSKEY